MSNSTQLTPGGLDHLCGIPILDKFAAVAKDCIDADRQEALDQAQSAYSDMWETTVRLAARVSELRALGTKNSRESRVLEILDSAVKALEAEGLGL